MIPKINGIIERYVTILYLVRNAKRLIKTVVNGDNALIVCTIETGMIEVALCEVICPTNWNIPIDNVVEIIKGVGATNVLSVVTSCMFGIDPTGKYLLTWPWPPIFFKYKRHANNVTQNAEFNTN
jgi:hypothetical protein